MASNVVECPICDTKYDISTLKDGMKLKCTRCHKVVGTIKGGELLPILETIKTSTAKSQPVIRKVATRPTQAIEESYNGGEQPEEEYEEVIIKRRVPHKISGGRHLSTSAYDAEEISARTRQPAEKPPLMLLLAGLTGLAATIVVIYIVVILYQPQKVFQAPQKPGEQNTPSNSGK